MFFINAMMNISENFLKGSEGISRFPVIFINHGNNCIILLL